jgi:hypothetical protein
MFDAFLISSLRDAMSRLSQLLHVIHVVLYVK